MTTTEVIRAELLTLLLKYAERTAACRVLGADEEARRLSAIASYAARLRARVLGIKNGYAA